MLTLQEINEPSQERIDACLRFCQNVPTVLLNERKLNNPLWCLLAAEHAMNRGGASVLDLDIDAVIPLDLQSQLNLLCEIPAPETDHHGDGKFDE